MLDLTLNYLRPWLAGGEGHILCGDVECQVSIRVGTSTTSTHLWPQTETMLHSIRGGNKS
jgi:hypothetical protein